MPLHCTQKQITRIKGLGVKRFAATANDSQMEALVDRFINKLSNDDLQRACQFAAIRTKDPALKKLLSISIR